LALCLICFAGGAAGYYATRPLYRSEGVVAFEPVRVTVLGERRVEPALDSYVDRQVELLRRGGITPFAMTHPEWTKLRPGQPSVNDVKKFSESVEAIRLPGNLIAVRFHDPDPVVAQAGAASLVTALHQLESGRARTNQDRMLKALSDRRALLGGDLARLDVAILDTAKNFGTADLAQMQTLKLHELMRLEAQLHDAQIAAATRPSTDARAALYDQVSDEFTAVARAHLRVKDIERQRAELLAARSQIQRRIDEIDLDRDFAIPLYVLSSGGKPTAPVVDHRVRNGVLSALGAVLLFVLLRATWHALRGWRRRLSVRTAFPVIITHAPKPAIPVDDAGAPVPAGT
jgi:uncharacterized protein involved in exopolysaccharide biosynthesis